MALWDLDSLSRAIPYAPLILVSLLVARVLTKLLHRNEDKEEEKKKKYKYHPVGGTVFHQLLNFGSLHHYMTGLAARYGTYRLLSPFRNEIYTADPANVEYVLKTNFGNYGKGEYNYRCLHDLLGDGIFTVDGERWRRQRKVSTYEFSTKVLRDFSSVIFRRNAAKLAVMLSEAASEGRAVDIQDLFMKSALACIFEVSFGVELDSMCGSREEGEEFIAAFDDASALTLWRYVDVFWRIKKLLNIGSEAKLRKSIGIVHRFIFKLINSKIQQMNSSKDCLLTKKEDILSRFLQTIDSNPTNLRDIILNFILAGKDTIATALSWFIYAMCKHPDIQEKVVRDVTGGEDVDGDFFEFAAGMTEEALERMHYLHATITETLRLYPSIAVDAKICFSDDTLPDGFSVRKGDMVSYQPYAMGRMKFVWGDDAEAFRPERWIDHDGKFHPESPFKFTAFQAGPRICLGKDFAYREMKITLAVLLGCFRFRLADEEKPVHYRTMLALHIDGGLHVRVFPRDKTVSLAT